jgi:hypothetical protein
MMRAFHTKRDGRAAMRRWASAAPVGRRVGRRSEEFSGLHEIALSDRPTGVQAMGSAQMRLLRLQTSWARAVGAPLRDVARLRACAGERLLVDVPDAAWKREMDRLKPHILERLAREVPCPPVTDLAFTIRPGARLSAGARAVAPWLAAATAAPPGGSEPLPEALSGALTHVEDPALRGRLGEVMERYLSRRTAPR